jgi:hypothetical protein
VRIERVEGCSADSEPDGDVDGSDLQALIAGTFAIDTAVFAGNFGRNDCGP